MKPALKRTLSIILSAALLVAALFIYVSFIKPAYLEITRLRGQVNSLTKTFNDSKTLNSKFQNIFSEYKNLSKLEEQFSLVLPPKLDAAYAMSQILGVAKANNFTVQSLNVKPMAAQPASSSLAKPLGILRIDTRFSGTYQDLKNFMKQLETNLMIADVASLKIDSQFASNVMTYSMTIDTYYQTE